MRKELRRTIGIACVAVMVGSAIGIAAINSEGKPVRTVPAGPDVTNSLTVQVPVCGAQSGPNGLIFVRVVVTNDSRVEHRISFGAKVFDGTKEAHSQAHEYTVKPGEQAVHDASIPPTLFPAPSHFRCDINQLHTLS